MPHKTNAARILDQLHIKYELKEFRVDLEDLSAAHIAEMLDVPADYIYKTIIMRGTKNPFLVAVLPSDAQIDLKKAAQASGDKSCELLHVKELQKITGYIRGGCSPVGMKKHFPTFIDKTAKEKELIFCSAGKRGMLMHLRPQDLIKASGAELADLVAGYVEEDG